MDRVRSVVSRVNQKATVQLAAVLISSSTLLSMLFGFFRERLLNGYYYDTYPKALDAYTAAFMVPDFMFFILVSGALSVTGTPVVSAASRTWRRARRPAGEVTSPRTRTRPQGR